MADKGTEALANKASENFAISPLVKMECLIKPFKIGDMGLQHRYESRLSEFIQLPLPETVFLQAVRLRARFGLKTPEAPHLACA